MIAPISLIASGDPSSVAALCGPGLANCDALAVLSKHDALDRLQGWYLDQCDGEWEHEFGIEIGTLDNPGWRVEISLTGTERSHESFNRTEIHRSEHDWVVCWTDAERDMFHAACGPRNLTEALLNFLQWARTPGR